jgi:hypothetical protein
MRDRKMFKEASKRWQYSSALMVTWCKGKLHFTYKAKNWRSRQKLFYFTERDDRKIIEKIIDMIRLKAAEKQWN